MMPERVGAALTTPGRGQHCQMARVRQARRRGVREEPALLRPSMRHLLEPGGSGQDAVRTHRGRWGTPGSVYGSRPGGHEEGLRRTRGDAAGTQLGSSFVERITVNTGTARHGSRPCEQPARRAGIEASTVERVGWGGAAVVVRGRESRSHGEGWQRFREGRRL